MIAYPWRSPSASANRMCSVAGGSGSSVSGFGSELMMTKLLRAHGDERTETHGAQRRSKRSRDRRDEHHDESRDECPRIGRLSAEQQCTHRARDEIGCDESWNAAEQRETARIAHDHPGDTPRLGAECQAHADLARALRDEVGEQSINADGGEQQREPRECDEYPQLRAAIGRLIADDLSQQP